MPPGAIRITAKEKSQRVAVEQDLNLRLRQQEAIARLGEYALGSQDLKALFDEAVRCVADTLEMEFCEVLELMPDGEALLLRAGVGWKEGLVGHAMVGTDLDSQAGYTLLMDEPVIVEDLRTETRFSGPALLREHQVVSGMSVVIPGKNRPFGVLGTHTTQRRLFHTHDTRFIKAIANILATAIQRSSAEEALRRSRDELAIILEGITEGVAVQDRQSRLIYANQAAAELMGFGSVEEAKAATQAEIFQRFAILDEQGKEMPLDQLPGRQVLRGEARASATVRFRINITGEERWSIVDATLIRDEMGQPDQVVSIFRNITDLVLSERYQHLLAEAGDLFASSLEYENILQHVAQLAVTDLADWCSVYLLTETQAVQHLIAAHKDPAKQALAEQYQQRFPVDTQSENGVSGVLKTGQTAYYPIITEELLERTVRDAEQLAIVRTLGMRSVLIVPLVARGRILGAISLVWAESGRRAVTRDVELAQELARRAALAIDNARLYRETQEANTALEQRVAARTQELVQANQQLANEVEERRKTEQALQKSEYMLRSLFESAPDGMFLVDQAGIIARVNQQSESLFGYGRSELAGMVIDQLIPLRFRAGHARKRQQYMQEASTRGMGAGLTLYAQRKDGSEFPVDIMLSPVRVDDGQMVICAVRNISEQKRLQTDLAETHRRLFESVEAERLHISRELHDGPIQDLYGIALYLESLREDIGEPRQVAEFQATMEQVQAIIQTLRGICGELRPPILEQFGLKKTILSHLMKVRESHPEIVIRTDLDNDGQSLSARTRLALFRVYQTAISNVFRHAEAKHIWIDFHIVESELRLEIKDDGRGFFVPGRWIDLAREGHFGLVGMAERVEAIGGRLEVEASVGEGTTVRVIAPFEQPQWSVAE